MAVSTETKERFRRLWGKNLPDGWRFRRFGDVLGRVDRPIEILDDQEYRQPVIRRNHGGIQLREVQLGKDILTKKQFEVRSGDWLMSKVQILHGAYGIVPPELNGAVASGSYFAFQPLPGLDLRYFWYLSHVPQFHRGCELSSVGVVIEKMVFRVEDWMELEFPAPPELEQRKIAAILSSLDEAIRAARAVVGSQRVVLGSLLRELIGSRSPASSATSEGSPLRSPLPEKWPVVRLGDVATVTGGYGFPLHLQGRKTGRYPLFKVSDMNRDGNDLWMESAENYVDDAILSELRGRPSPPGTTVFPKVGAALLTNKRRLLRVEALFDNNVMGLVPTRVDRGFLFWFMSTVDFASMVQTGAVPSVNGSLVGNIQMPLPPPEEQRRVSDILFSVLSAVQAAENGVSALQGLKRSVADRLLTGEVRVTTDEVVA